MNREIKFRAWDDGSQRLHTNVFFLKTGDNGNDWIVFSSDEQRHKVDDNQIIFDNPYFSQQIQLMQYTGLKDKNGKEIYEGDILKTRICRHGVPTKDGKSIEVFGGDGLDVVYAKWDEYRIAEFKTDSHSTSFSIPKEDGTYQGRGRILEWEIVGNIYENPELLKEIEKTES